MNHSPLNNESQDKIGKRHALKKSPFDLAQEFWNAHPLAFFGQDVVAAVRDVSIATLENERWRGAGIAYRKVSGRVLYRKSDVIQFLESHELVTSTSEYTKSDDKEVK